MAYEEMKFNSVYVPNFCALAYNEKENLFHIHTDKEVDDSSGVFALISMRIAEATSEDMTEHIGTYYITMYVQSEVFTSNARMTALSSAFFNIFARVLSSQGPKIFKSTEMNKTETVLAILPRFTVKGETQIKMEESAIQDLENTLFCINSIWQSDVNKKREKDVKA